MADISSYITELMSATYGEEVRESIRDSLLAMNNDVIGLKTREDIYNMTTETLSGIADAVIDSIPSDYTTLSNDVDVLKDDVDDLKNDLGVLSNLNTDDKSNLVNAVNEVNDHFLEYDILNTTLTGTSLFSSTPSGSVTGCNGYKKGKIVHLDMSFGSLSLSTTMATIGNLVSEFRPLHEVFCSGYIGTSTSIGDAVRIVISTNGDIKAICVKSIESTLRFSITFFA